MTKIAIQGAKESFHAIAAKTMFPGSEDLLECDSFKKVFSAVENDEAEYGVVAIENSLYGSINDTYDLLVKHNLHICGEAYEQIGLHLLGTNSSSLQTITDIYSHPAALGESVDYLDKNLPDARRHESGDTALSARIVAESADPTKAAIAGQLAADAYNVKILAHNIETHRHNYTRFIAISKKPVKAPAEASKSTIVFQTSNAPGSLYAALGVFAKSNISLTKLESRPIVGKAWRYMYYVDIEAPFTNILETELSEFASNIRLLGCYKSGSMIVT